MRMAALFLLLLVYSGWMRSKAADIGVQVSPGTQFTIKKGDPLEFVCNISQEIDQCNIRLPSGIMLSLRPGRNAGVLKYVGRGLQFGDCGIRVQSVDTSYGGVYTCGLARMDTGVHVEENITLTIAEKVEQVNSGTKQQTNLQPLVILAIVVACLLFVVTCLSIIAWVLRARIKAKISGWTASIRTSPRVEYSALKDEANIKKVSRSIDEEKGLPQCEFSNGEFRSIELQDSSIPGMAMISPTHLHQKIDIVI